MKHLFFKQIELDELSHLNKKLTLGCYPLLVTSNPYVKRGYDFRSQKLGMILRVATSFASMRDADQISGRFG